MLSGAYLLDENKEITYKKIYKKYILRVSLALLIFNTAYVLYYYFFVNNNSNIFKGIFLGLIRTIRGDPSGDHLWYLYLCLSLYLLTPIIRIFTKNSSKKDLEYLLIIGLIFTFFLPTITNYSIFKSMDFSNYFAFEMGTTFSIGFFFYYIMGYYLKKYQTKRIISKKTKTCIYLLGILGVLFTIIIGNYISYKTGAIELQRGYSYFSINVCLVSIAVFTLFNRDSFTKNEKTKKIISYLSKRTFGIYLFHMFVVLLMTPIYKIFNPIAGTPILVICTFILSLLLTEIFGLIPKVKKYILLY